MGTHETSDTRTSHRGRQSTCQMILGKYRKGCMPKGGIRDVTGVSPDRWLGLLVSMMGK